MSQVPSIIELQNRFLVMLPRIVTHARIFFRQVPCRTKREEFVAETVALAWQWHLRMASQGKDARQFVSVLAAFAARAAKSGRKLAAMNKDVMNERPQMKRGFVVGKLPDFSCPSGQPRPQRRYWVDGEGGGKFERGWSRQQHGAGAAARGRYGFAVP
ncbi:MAG: hypothetical protein JNM56_02760, partial [Planctomycetia bacterium]|nr:hypothetical protein [Planctomycetia bacterium]